MRPEIAPITIFYILTVLVFLPLFSSMLCSLANITPLAFTAQTTMSPTPFLDATLKDLAAAQTPAQIQPISTALLKSLQHELANSTQCMLPSFIYRHPSGHEHGHALALDLGGSTLRVAIVHLSESVAQIIHRKDWFVSDIEKQYNATTFFDWIAGNIKSLLDAVPEAERPPVIGVSWSFPIIQTSLASGNIAQMGKGYQTATNPPTLDIRTLFHDAFARAGLKLTMTTLMNDTEATLLTHAYAHPEKDHTFSVILGTGMNAAISVPVTLLPIRKLGERPENWKRVAKNVLLNTELSMFGKNGKEWILPATEVDEELDAAQQLPGFQPLEQVTSGRYIGEIVRRHAVKLAEEGELFTGRTLGERWNTPFALETPLAIMFESEPSVEAAKASFGKYGFGEVDFTEHDVRVLGEVTRAVTQRAAVYTAIAVWTLWKMQEDAVPGDGGVVGIAYTGAVLENHVGVRERCQQVLDQMSESEGGRWRLVLESAAEAGLVGAAVGALVGVDCEREMEVESEIKASAP